VFVPALDVDVEVVLPTTGTLRLNWGSASYADYSSTDVDTIRVSGLASGIANGTFIANGIAFDHYTSQQSLGGWVDVNADGSFTIDIDLLNQWNDIYLRTCSPPHTDPTVCNAPHDNFSLHVYTEAGSTPPKFVSIDSPAHNSKIPFTITGATIYGHLDIGNFAGAATNWYFSVYNYDSPSWQYPSVTYDSVTGYFYGAANFTADQMYRIYVEALDSGTGIYHGHYVYINNYRNYGEYFYKPEGSSEYTRQMVLDAAKSRRR
jgi:hypothetical protein